MVMEDSFIILVTLITYLIILKIYKDGICEEFDELLHKYQHITKMTDRRINKICTLLFSRINKLKKKIEAK